MDLRPGTRVRHAQNQTTTNEKGRDSPDDRFAQGAGLGDWAGRGIEFHKTQRLDSQRDDRVNSFTLTTIIRLSLNRRQTGKGTNPAHGHLGPERRDLAILSTLS